ncbi:hypothetical protein E4U43_000535 [Claviceps pusilla]|uniref:Mating-type switching protein swi10 n=1 Tax=Claviceps pusilla TaxID=123648 RepID=A0A9P7SZ07_9HYPO|nr:hypothetical protein E4U43_000535 [Claviceps pusilla]
MAVRISASPVSSPDRMSPTSTTSSKSSRRSFIVMATNLKPTRQKLQKYFAKSKHSVSEPVCKDWETHSLSSVIKMASLQMGTLGNPHVPMPISSVPEVQDSQYKPAPVRVVTEQQQKHKPGSTPKLGFLDTETKSDLAPPPLSPPSPPPSAPEGSAQTLMSSSLAAANYSVASAVSPSNREEFHQVMSSPSLTVADSSVGATALSPAPDSHVQSPLLPPLASADASVEATFGPPLRSLSPSPHEVAGLLLPPDIMSMETEPTERRVRRGPSLIKPRRKPSVRRQVKTPVRKSGHRDESPAMSRQCSVRSIARQYRTLIEDTVIEETDVPEVPCIPLVYSENVSDTAAPAPVPEWQDFDHNYGPIRRCSAVVRRRGTGRSKSPRPRSGLMPSPVPSDAGTSGSFQDEAAYLTPFLFPSPLTSPVAQEEPKKEGEGGEGVKEYRDKDDDFFSGPVQNAASFQIAFKLLTRELSTAFADQSTRSATDTSGLQVWVMIAAYERLRDEISAMQSPDPHLQGARAMFDTWLDALRAVQHSLADMEAESGSEYGDDTDE